MITNQTNILKIYLSALAAKVIDYQINADLLAALANYSNTQEIARSFGDSRLVRQLNLKRNRTTQLPDLKFINNNVVIYENQEIGQIKTLYKKPLPGELQAKLAIESAIDRFLEYLQKIHHIVVLHESDSHVIVFQPPKKETIDFSTLWNKFLEDIAFSKNGFSESHLRDLTQTFILLLNSVTLSGRGFSTLEVPIICKEQADILAACYLAIIYKVQDRQIERQRKIDDLKNKPATEKKLQELQDMQDKEAKKYSEYFQKSFDSVLKEQESIWIELEDIEYQLKSAGLTKSQINKLNKQKEKLSSQVIFSQESVAQKISLLDTSCGIPFEFIKLDSQQNPEKFKDIIDIYKRFNKTATDQINSTRGDIFTQCILEMYRLLEKQQPYDPKPEALLSEKPIQMEVRSPGDDGKEFCYSCGVKLDPKTAKWKVARFMFERPSQRRQSSSSEDRPYICASCSTLAFASPLKVTDESIILKLKDVNKNNESVNFKLKEYIRMLTTKELNLSSGQYLLLTSEKTTSGDIASDKLGQVQYALAKVASIFPTEVLTDFGFYLVPQGSKEIKLANRHLVFIKGLMECYGQSIIVSGKDINNDLGEAVRYVEQDLPLLADYSLVKSANVSNKLQLEQIRELYYKILEGDMNSSKQLSKRAQLYRDVAALTGLTYAFVQSLESTARKSMKIEDAEREMSKIIEQVNDAVAFCYYATLGDQDKKTVQARLYHNSDNYFIYDQAKDFLETKLQILEREEKDEAKQQLWLTFYADDVIKAYTYFAENGYGQDREWNELTYNLKLSLYTRFPELVRKLKTTSEK
ncbi:hypothetical protein VB713_08920 [Anabaena cylindrica UHCC 0172]|uniref:hypothetical protein n=1 Tax=Anabaena cylindrica TaxID=1165 RepID=UPI002B1EFC24|nr:hypothetical protein [Anabaena cylindrica]MEA5551095.1 hypothetical protein [Anabaena cylindrica UHCC 0172]